MNRFGVAVVAAGFALSTGVASQAPLVQIQTLVDPAGATQRVSGYRSPGTEGATFAVAATQSVTAIEEHYRKQLTAAGWKAESTGGNASIAYSRFTIPAQDSPRAGTLIVAPVESGRLFVAMRAVRSMEVPAPPAPKTESEMMDWMLRQLPRSESTGLPVAASQLPGTFPTELLPARLKSIRISSNANGVTIAGTVDDTKPSDLLMFFAALRKAGWSDSLRGWLTQPFVVADFCKNDVRASIVFTVEPKRVLMAGVSTDKPERLGCEFRAKSSPGITGPVVVLPSEWSPAHRDGGGGASQWRAGVRLSTATPVVSILADVESQIAASGYRVTARASDASQSHVRFESTQIPGSSAVVLLSMTKLPWSPQIDVVYELVTWPKR